MNTATRELPVISATVKFSPSDIARFWAKVDKNGPLPDQSNPHYSGLDRCWLWLGGVFVYGYGAFNARKISYRAHRVSWMVKNGQIPNETCVMHRCDKRLCVNPAHLQLGTIAENIADRGAKNRSARVIGGKNGLSKLNDRSALEIRTLCAKGDQTYRSLAIKYGVSGSTIADVIHRKTWKHIP